MARPIFDFELADPDFSWLLEQYQERHPRSVIVSGTPIIILVETPEESPHAIEIPEGADEFVRDPSS
jgi:hypothetical protein